MKFNLACLLITGEVEKFTYPFVISLQTSKGFPFFIETLLDSTTVITAAHCSNKKIEEVSVNVHRHDLRLKPEQKNGAKLKVKSIYSHPLYNNLNGHDIAIWKLAAPIPKNITVYYVTLDNDNLGTQTGLSTITSGWGKTSQDGSGSKVLKSVLLPIYDNNECKKVYGHWVIKGKIVCAGSKTEDISK